MTEHHDSKDTDSKDTPTTPQENASENAAPDTFDYVVDYWDDEGSASNDSSDAVIEALSATVDANATDPTDGDTDADGEPAADKSRETAPAHPNENAQVTVPDVVQVADHLDSSLQAEEDGEDAALAGSSIFRAYPMLSLHDVTVSDPKTKEHIWQHLTFRCEAGECYAIMVDAHDTRRHATLLALIGGFIAPSSGEIMTKTTPYEDMDAEQLRGHRLGMITPQFSLRGDLNAVENLTYVMNASGQTFMKPVKGLAQDLLVRTRFGENTKADESTLAGELDPVDAARLSIARALAIDPDYIIADDLTVNLNETDAKQILDLLKAQVSTPNKQRTVIVVTASEQIAKQFDNIIDLR